MSFALQDRKETRGALTFGEKSGILKRYEVYCYQTAYYLLQNEAGARHAAEQTLLALYQRCHFFELPDDGRKAEVKAEAMRQSLLVRHAAVSGPSLRA